VSVCACVRAALDSTWCSTRRLFYHLPTLEGVCEYVCVCMCMRVCVCAVNVIMGRVIEWSTCCAQLLLLELEVEGQKNKNVPLVTSKHCLQHTHTHTSHCVPFVASKHFALDTQEAGACTKSYASSKNIELRRHSCICHCFSQGIHFPHAVHMCKRAQGKFYTRQVFICASVLKALIFF
jgi:hypothetical protein